MKVCAKILLVADEIAMLNATRRSLESAGYDVITAENGADGLRLAETALPDLALIDRVLPDLDGLEICRRLKTNPVTARIFVVLRAALKTSRDDQAEGMETGADGYIARPISNRELVARVQSLLRIKHAEDALRVSEQQLQEQYGLLQGIFESTNDLIFAVDHEYQYTSFNRAYAAMMHALYGADIQRGHCLLDYLSIAQDRSAAQRNLERALQGECFTEASFSGKEQLSRLYFEVAYNPIRNAAGQVIGVAVFAKDGIASREAEAEVRRLLEQTQQSRRVLLSMLEDRKHAEEALQQLNAQLEDRVQERTAQLHAVNERLQAEIAERIAIEDVLQQAKDSAEAANRAKSSFLANMSHELRTPLNAILGYAQILPEADNLTDQQRHAIQTIKHSGEHLLHMINEILDLSKVEAGRMELNITDVCLPELLKNLGDMIRIRAQQQGIAFVTDYAPDLPTGIRTDDKRLQEVLLNLLSNAVKFTKQGSVRLRVYELHEFNELEISETQKLRNSETHQLRFEVEDTGIGIASDDLDKMFLPFHQVGEVSRSVEGTGLGLAISRRFVELMGGTLQANSTPGVGSTFWIDLPVTEVPVLRLERSVVQSRILGYTGQRRIVLIVDDHVVNRELMMSMLLPLGFKLGEAANGPECLEKARQLTPDLILLDLRMPDMDGFEVAHELRQREALQRTRIIAFSASAFAESRQHSLDAGCDDFLAKPIQREELLSILQKQLQLEWIYEHPQEPLLATAQPPSHAHLLAQIPPDTLERLRQQAIRGNIKGVFEQLDALEQLDDHVLPAVQELRELARRFQVDQIVELLEQKSYEEG